MADITGAQRTYHCTICGFDTYDEKAAKKHAKEHEESKEAKKTGGPSDGS